ncbi:uncharacterized protein METZ01_LOCUS450989 [marine metagenome]|uniref:Uncharacterized protein n=1 Tax=marine metagenome TaxID=408172 RepID=A0A382ZSV8_9ZZZZ
MCSQQNFGVAFYDQTTRIHPVFFASKVMLTLPMKGKGNFKIFHFQSNL